MSIQSHLDKTSLGSYVELFDLDLTELGGGVLYFVSGTISNQPIQWQGNSYLPIPVEFSGLSYSSVGAEPEPVVKFSNVDRILMNEILSLGDLVGGKLIRHRTFGQFLDSGSSPDPTMELPVDKWIIKKLAKLNAQEIEYQLMTLLDNPLLMIPRRQVLIDEYQGADGETYSFPGTARRGARRAL